MNIWQKFCKNEFPVREIVIPSRSLRGAIPSSLRMRSFSFGIPMRIEIVVAGKITPDIFRVAWRYDGESKMTGIISLVLSGVKKLSS